MIEHRFLSQTHIRLVNATEKGPTLLYIHGLGESALGFEEVLQAERLSHLRHVAPDLPGYGKSPWTDRPLNLEELADSIAGWLPDLISEPAIVLGHSMGGVIGLMLCERHPRLVQGFLNVEGNISQEDCNFSGRISRYSEHKFLTEGFEKTRQGVYQEGLTSPALRTYFASMSLCDPRSLYLNSHDLVQVSRTEELATRLRALRIPQLYLLGSPDGTGEHSRALLDEAGVPWKAIENAGHWPFLDQHQSFVEEVAAFLDLFRS